MNRFLAILLFGISPLFGSEELDLARATLKEWVSVEKSISREKEAWRNKKATVLDLIAVFEKESEVLRGRIEATGDGLSISNSRRAELVEEEVGIDGLRDSIENFLGEMEAELHDLGPWLPKPLFEKLGPFYGRLPASSGKASLGIAERMQTVVGILSRVHKFDEKITLSHELRDLSDGKKGEVQALYLGLASAYYLAPSGADAGVGSPGLTGWQWESVPELADRIEEAIAVYEGRQQEAKFLPLPVEIRGVE